ncbi:MAG: beta-ketoacyl-[acyl-carrier-protein] synthase family protein [Methylomonas sp.]|jgi:3-oxoacyl-[acyl-carrier-protein] synthase-1|uniref:beta-ketoacyl-[acyl-carrier-protein] synthase family protein n=1 Tax=Methylomonas sp. TaxID=418 RepID=UPI0025F6D679|nr:beta-ketoacyl-[acyl-carrier-protein] synthase family protein [Methylomonas sp.]MCK9606581.1 beta-ketoacyl-[acyl-carrier-protein] synthase family protein [Methylomonas sp.]
MYLHDLGIVCALGSSKAEVLSSWLAGRISQAVPPVWLNTAVPAISITADLPTLPPDLQRYACRNNRLLLAALQQIAPAVESAITRYGRSRIGLLLGTSTSGIAEGESAVSRLLTHGQLPAAYHYKQQELGGATEFLVHYLNIQGPAYTVSTTCSSSANALASARRLLRLNLCDAVIVGGADALCHTTLQGFSGLGALSRIGCNPFSKNRDGTVIGEGAALFLMTRESAPIALLGVGANADAYHISAPRPDGSRAHAAMQNALLEAGRTAEQVDYINLHGTATLQNDAMESRAVATLFGADTPCGSSKPATGHCLGAAGAIEAGLCWLLLSALNGELRLPPHLWDGEPDPKLPPLGFVTLDKRQSKRLQYCLSNSFSFGGNNVSLLIGRC